MTDIIYARYSSDSQREESIEGQIRECKAYAEKNGITILSTYIDRAFSAKTDNRPEFQRMVKDSAKHLFDVVIVWKLDRFARNRYDSAHYEAILRRNGAKVISATEPSRMILRASCLNPCWRATLNFTPLSFQRRSSAAGRKMLSRASGTAVARPLA